MRSEDVFQIGDLVSRDGTDVQRVTRVDDDGHCITVVCVRAPLTGWCKVGDMEDNLTRRYSFAGDVIDGDATVISGRIAPPVNNQRK